MHFVGVGGIGMSGIAELLPISATRVRIGCEALDGDRRGSSRSA